MENTYFSMNEYLCWCWCSVWLWKIIRCSSLLSSFCAIIATILLFGPYAYMMKSFAISRFLSIEASIIAFFISLKDTCASYDQENIASFFSIEVIGDTISKKLLMNFLTKIMWPRNDCKAFLLEGNDNASIAFTMSRSIANPSFKTMWPSYFPWLTIKINFFRFIEMPNFMHFSKTCLRCSSWSLLLLEKTMMSSR